MKTAIFTIILLAIYVGLSTAQFAPGSGQPPSIPTDSGGSCESQKEKCKKNAGGFAGLLRPIDACKPLRRCKKVCRKEKRSDKRACRRTKRSCKGECRRVRRGRRRHKCRRACRRTKRRCARTARKTKRSCRSVCCTTYKTRACKKARRKILGSGLKTVYHCVVLATCIGN